MPAICSANVTQAVLRERYCYHPMTGEFWNRATGQILGSINEGYVRLNMGVLGRHYAQQIIWLYVTGEWAEQVDHIDHDRTNNRWSNLRKTDSQGNSMNRGSSGQFGINKHGKSGKWRARITVNRKLIHLGIHATYDEAVSARVSAEHYYGFHKNHGK